MKGNKMSAILAILLMLSGVLFVPYAFAQTPADSCQANPLNVSWTYPAHGPGDTFTAYADVTNVAGLFSFQIGFYFDPNYLEVVPGSVLEGGFLSNGGADTLLSFPGTIDNVAGVVNAYGWSLTDALKAKTGSGHLIAVQMRVKAGLWPPYTGTSPGTPVLYMDLTVTPFDPAQLVLMYNDGVSEITPLPEDIHDGYFTLSVSEANPVAAFTWSPVPSYAAEAVTFDGSTSTPGWNGYANVPITNYHWVWGDTFTDDTASPTIDHTFAAAGTYTVTLTVTDADGRVSLPVSHDVQVILRPTGAFIDLQSQRWRYVDPTFWATDFFGEGPNFPADTFRPGDLVELWAYTDYNGDPVQDQLVAFEVHDNQGNIVLVGTAQSDVNGWAYYPFRIPWPCTGPEPYFGIWDVIAKWSIGEYLEEGKPYAHTINDTMQFKVSWGLEIVEKVECDEFGNPKGEFYKSELVYVKLTIKNDYMMPVVATIAVTLYDDLLVPINTPAIAADVTIPSTGIFCTPYYFEILMPGIHIEKWAYVGLGTAAANVFTKLPFLCGTSYAPEVRNTFVIKKTPGEPWYPDP